MDSPIPAILAMFATQAQANEGPSYRPFSLTVPRGGIAVIFLETEGFSRIPQPLVIRVKLPARAPPHNIGVSHIIDGDVGAYIASLDAGAPEVFLTLVSMTSAEANPL